MQQPEYYSSYQSLLKRSASDDLQFFLSFLSSLRDSQWCELLEDLFSEKPYPALLQKVRKDYSTVTYFAIYINKLSPETRATIDRCINSIVKNAIIQNPGNIETILTNAAVLSKLLEGGLWPKILIEDIISSNIFSPSLKFDAAVTLSFYTDVTTLDFWKYRCPKLMTSRDYHFLSLPSFRFLTKIDPYKAFQSLEFFNFTSFIKPEDVILTLEDFFYEHLKNNKVLNDARKVFQTLSDELKEVILNTVLANRDLHFLKDFFATPVSEEYFYDIDSIQDINEAIFDESVFQNLESNSYKTTFNSIAVKLNPFKSFSPQEINSIDPSFIQKSHIFTCVNNGISHFKKSEFQSAMTCYVKAFNIFRSAKHRDNLTVYLYSWMLHEVGNIFFVHRELEPAKKLYINSYRIKSGIEEIPKTFLYATQLKMLALYLESEDNSEDWENNLKSLISRLKKFRKITPKNNHFFVDCLLGDANFYLSKYHYRHNNTRSFLSRFNTSLKYCTSNDDLNGRIKLLTLYSLAKKSDTYFGEIETLFSHMNEQQRKNPYLATLLNSYQDKNSLSNEIYDRLKTILSKYVTQLEDATSNVNESIFY